MQRTNKGPAFYSVPKPGMCGKTTFDCGAINFRMVMHNAHQKARLCSFPSGSYRERFAYWLKDFMSEAHSMSAWKRGQGVKMDAAYIASVSTDGPVNFKIAAE